ncbi:MAG: hypothetical protein O2798_11120 [Chloroflexi bacterium]|nr:hypothetical protein [Chloroflexota bacterium]
MHALDASASSSLASYDILIFSPISREDVGLTAKADFYDTAGQEFDRRIQHWRSEMAEFLDDGKTVFVFATWPPVWETSRGRSEDSWALLPWTVKRRASQGNGARVEPSSLLAGYLDLFPEPPRYESVLDVDDLEP